MKKLVFARNLLLMKAAADVAAVFERRGIEVVLLKGAALLALEKADWGAREMTDIDVLVRPRDLERAQEALEGLEFRPMDGSRQAWGLLEEGKAPVLIDLHDRLRYRSDVEEVFREAAAVELDGARALVPSAVECVLECVSHAFLHHGKLDAKSLDDLRSLLREEIDWRLLAERALRFNLAELTYASLARAGLAHPGIEALKGRGPRRWAAAAAAAGAMPAAELSLPALFAPRFALSRLWPAAAEMRRTYPDLPLWAAHLKRFGGLAARAFGAGGA